MKRDVIFFIIGLIIITSIFGYKYYTEEKEASIEKAPNSLPDNVIVYSYGPNGLAAKSDSSGTYYYHKDHLGSNSLVTDEEGDIVYSSDYEPYGSSFNEEGEERYTYNNKELDSSGLYYYGARYYDSSLGRFISADPIKDYLFSPYVYVRDNPMKYVDPSGMEKKRALIIAASPSADWNGAFAKFEKNV